MALRRGREGASHHIFHELPGLLPSGGVLVVNNTRVMPCRLAGLLPGGGKVDALLVAEEAPGRWVALIKNARRIKPGMTIRFADGAFSAMALERSEGGQWRLEFPDGGALPGLLARHGMAPLPPYIRRDPFATEDGQADRQAYQTIFARVKGAIAAPTAGLHFTPRILEEVGKIGLDVAEVTLHVGIGTFAKIESGDLSRHTMHREWYVVPARAASLMKSARREGRPVIAVGTTTVRALESWHAAGCPEGHSGWSELFIRPPYRFGAVDGLITNFHQPRSTLLLLVSAFHGRESLLRAYDEAIERGYRFFSYGDCMAILPDAQFPRR